VNTNFLLLGIQSRIFLSRCVFFPLKQEKLIFCCLGIFVVGPVAVGKACYGRRSHSLANPHSPKLVQGLFSAPKLAACLRLITFYALGDMQGGEAQGQARGSGGFVDAEKCKFS